MSFLVFIYMALHFNILAPFAPFSFLFFFIKMILHANQNFFILFQVHIFQKNSIPTIKIDKN